MQPSHKNYVCDNCQIQATVHLVEIQKKNKKESRNFGNE